MMDNFKYRLEKYLPAIFFILLLLFFLYCWFLERKMAFKEALLWAQHDSIRIADSLKRIEIETKGVEEIHIDTIFKSDREKLPVSIGEIRDTSYIIVGSFINPENAKLVAAKYRSLGYKTSIISATNRNGIKAELVSVNTFNNFNEAIRYLRGFQSKFDSKAWIYLNQ
jgi:hypothetical protein